MVSRGKGSKGSELVLRWEKEKRGRLERKIRGKDARHPKSFPLPSTTVPGAASSTYGSVNISATKVLIENQTKGGDSLRCNLSSTNGIKKLN